MEIFLRHIYVTEGAELYFTDAINVGIRIFK